MSKTIRAILSAFAAAAILTGCGAAGGSGNCTYVDIYGVQNKIEDFRVQPDAALDAVIAENDPEPSDIVTLNDGSFTIRQHLNANDTVIWSGTYSSENNALKFNYSGAEVSGSLNGQTFQNRIPSLNESGSFPDQIMPLVYLSDIARTNSKLPIAVMRSPEAPFSAEQHGDFLCVPMYGLTVSGNYQQGSRFEMEYDPADTLRSDRYSLAYYNEADASYSAQPNAETMNFQLQMLANRYGMENPDDLRFHLTFSDGKWEMQSTADGKLISSGSYAESKKHSGFLTMYEDPAENEIANDYYPLFLSIDNDRIYYPGFIRKG